ncbi:hypothetical protein [Flavobacterium sp.]|uniref:hypothetical protein n=1 Tax=Flavobacterium sp. TaxID=239 RepID=UPI00391C5DFA
MKKSILLLIVISLSLFSCEQKKTFTEPNDLGKEVFSLIKDVNSKSFEEYKKQVISFEEIKSLVNDANVPISESFRNDLKSVTSEKYEEVIFKDYNRTKTEGLDYGIDWSKITYRDFTYELQEVDGGKGLIGRMYFQSQDDKTYSIKCEAFFDGKGYRIIRIFGIQPKENANE